ncbi:MAG: hypothetical protein NC823_01385, partial [Candidatus Omnitrophica bacterium]|nr:hypothetical protein [Candidatus Omnitrophota bacterium]
MTKKVLTWLIFLLCLVLFPFSGQARTMNLTYTFSPPQVEKKDAFHYIQIPGCDYLSLPGLPVLPVRLARILLPERAEVTKVQVDADRALVFPERVSLAALPNFRRLNQTGETPLAEYPGSYPAQPYEVLGIQKLAGYQILLVRLFPVRFDGQEKRLLFTPKMFVRVEMKETVSSPLKGLVVRPQGEKWVRQWVDNPSEIASYQATSTKGPNYQYVIITTSDFVSAF